MLTYDMERRGRLPLYDYLCRCIKEDIWSGTLGPGEKLPSKRALAQHLEVSVITVKNAYEQLIDSLTRNRRKNLEGQFDLFSLGQEKPEPVELVLRDLPEFSQEELMTMEKEVTGLYLSGHPMDAYREAARRRGAVTIGSILSLSLIHI